MRGFRLLYELTVERHIRHGRRFAFQPVTEKAIVNDRWTSNGQHVLHTTAHKTYAYVSTAPEKKTPRTPFCLNERGAPPPLPASQGGECVRDICISFALSAGENTPDEFSLEMEREVTPFPLPRSSTPFFD